MAFFAEKRPPIHRQNRGCCTTDSRQILAPYFPENPAPNHPQIHGTTPFFDGFAFNARQIFWPLEFGRWILEHGQLPPGDTFSWTHTGKPYLLTQWLGEVAIAFAYQLGGPLGTTLLATALAGTAIGFAWRSAARYVESPVALTLAVLCNAILIVMAMRPQMFSFAATAIAIHLLLSWRESGRLRSAALLVVLLAAWTNLHGAFVIGVLLLGINATGSTAEWILSKRPAGLSSFVRNQWRLLIAGLAATGINPASPPSPMCS